MNFSYLGTYVKSKHIHVLSNSEAEVEGVWHVQENVYVHVFYSNFGPPLIGIDPHRHKPGPSEWLHGLNIRKIKHSYT